MLMGFVVVAAVSETPFVNSLKQCWGERPLIFPLHDTTNLVRKKTSSATTNVLFIIRLLLFDRI